MRVYSSRYSNGIRTSTCRDNCGGKLNCCVSWHCMLHIAGLHMYRLTQGHRGEWVSLLSHFSACFKTLVTKPSCFVCSADKDTTLYIYIYKVQFFRRRMCAICITNRKIITDKSCQLSDLTVTRLMCKCAYKASPNDFLTLPILCLLQYAE